jgi:hypothetical protein
LCSPESSSRTRFRYSNEPTVAVEEASAPVPDTKWKSGAPSELDVWEDTTARLFLLLRVKIVITVLGWSHAIHCLLWLEREFVVEMD